MQAVHRPVPVMSSANNAAEAVISAAKPIPPPELVSAVQNLLGNVQRPAPKLHNVLFKAVETNFSATTYSENAPILGSVDISAKPYKNTGKVDKRQIGISPFVKAGKDSPKPLEFID